MSKIQLFVSKLPPKLQPIAQKCIEQLQRLQSQVEEKLRPYWEKYSPQIKQLDYAQIKAFVLKYKWRIIGILFVLYAGSKIVNYFFPAADKVGGPVTVTTVLVEPKDVPLVIEASGTIVSNNIVDIRPMITNTVAKILVKDGQEVKAGDLLFQLDDRNDKANYDKLKALADDAQSQYLRAKELVAKNFISKAGLETSNANAKSALAAAKAAEDRQYETDLNKVYVRGRATDKLVPLSSVASFVRKVGPTAVNHQGQIPAVTLSFNLAPDVFLGDATKKIESYCREIGLPPSIITSYGGDAAVFKSNQSGQIILILAALGVIYIILGVLYESYIHPLTILAGLPSAAIGAILALRLFGFELTVIASIGILLLIGIVKKNAILMIDFALQA